MGFSLCSDKQSRSELLFAMVLGAEGIATGRLLLQGAWDWIVRVPLSYIAKKDG
jgi:hypothetical protein